MDHNTDQAEHNAKHLGACLPAPEHMFIRHELPIDLFQPAYAKFAYSTWWNTNCAAEVALLGA